MKASSGILPGITESEALKVINQLISHSSPEIIQGPRAGVKVFTKFESDLCPLLLDVISSVLLTMDI